MKKKWIIIGVSVLIVGLIGINVWKGQSSSSEKVEVATLTEEEMLETVMTPGTLQLDKEQLIFNQPERGEIVEIFVEEGEKVKENDKLLRYENKQLDLEEKQNELQIRSLHLELERIREQHRKIDKELAKETDNDMLQEEHDQISLQHKQMNLDLEQANLQKESIELQMEDLIVTSNVDGTILAINEVAKDSASQAGEKSVIRIGSLNDLIVAGTISEYDTLKITEGQNVVLTSDAVPDEEWKGKVSFIADLPNEGDGFSVDPNDAAVLYPIRVTVEEKINLKPGFKMLIEIETSKETVSTLPINAVKQDDDDNYVFVVTNGKVKRVDVKIGSVDTERIEIESGITGEDEVVVDPSEELIDGMEVTVK